MSAYKHLPIYGSSYALLRTVVEITKAMPRDFKFSLGERIKDKCIELVVDIYWAISSKDRLRYLDNLLHRLAVVELLLQLAVDMKVISIGQYAQTIELTDEIGRQAGGWRKAQRAPGA